MPDNTHSEELHRKCIRMQSLRKWSSPRPRSARSIHLCHGVIGTTSHATPLSHSLRGVAGQDRSHYQAEDTSADKVRCVACTAAQHGVQHPPFKTSFIFLFLFLFLFSACGYVSPSGFYSRASVAL